MRNRFYQESSAHTSGASLSDRETDGEDAHTSGDDKPKLKESISFKKVITRTLTACLLAGLYLTLLMSGHLYCIIAMALTQTEVYREIVNVRYVEAKERAMPLFRTLQYAWFAIPMFFVYGETFHRFCREHSHLQKLTVFTQHIHQVVFVSYWILFVCSILTLKRGLMKFQISQFMWSIVSVCLVVIQCKFFASNTLNGLFWYFFPMSAVMMNDVSAYFSGICFGRKLIKAPFFPLLSPNKTWEGFIGAGICTVIFCFFFSGYLAQFTWFTCPADGLYIKPFPPPLSCEPNPVFLLTPTAIPYLGTFMLYPIQMHAIVYGLFASIVAPFGGFFASAIKRAYGLKDFDSFMPGHGGMMDRMDCQIIMIPFTTFYYHTFIASKAPSIPKMLFLFSLMSPQNKLRLFNELASQLGMESTISN